MSYVYATRRVRASRIRIGQVVVVDGRSRRVMTVSTVTSPQLGEQVELCFDDGGSLRRSPGAVLDVARVGGGAHDGG